MRRSNLLLTSVIAILVLAACGGAATPANPPAAGGATSAPAAGGATSAPAAGGGQAVTIQFLTIDDPDMLLATKADIDAWKQSDPKYANVTVNVNTVPFAQLFPKIESAVASGADLDLFLADGPDIK